MPMVDVYARADLFPPGTDRQLGEELTKAVLRAERVAIPGPFHLNNTAAYIHCMDPGTIHTAVQEIEAAGGRGLACPVDVRDDAQIEVAVRQTIEPSDGPWRPWRRTDPRPDGGRTCRRGPSRPGPRRTAAA